MRVLSHGTIIHGKQFLGRQTGATRRLTYYGLTSGVGLALRSTRARGPLRVGVVGLGAGTHRGLRQARATSSASTTSIPRWSTSRAPEFTFLKDSPRASKSQLGDARLSLEREAVQNFDVARARRLLERRHSGAPAHRRRPSAPTLRQLKPGGVLAVHISNRYLDLVPVVQQAARELSLELREVDNDDDDNAGVYRSDWLLLSDSPAAFEGRLLREVAQKIETAPRVRLWTDDYSDLCQILSSAGPGSYFFASFEARVPHWSACRRATTW